MSWLITAIGVPFDPRGTLARGPFVGAVGVSLVAYGAALVSFQRWAESLGRDGRFPENPVVTAQVGIVMTLCLVLSIWVFGVLAVKRGRSLGLSARTTIWRASIPPANVFFHLRLLTEADPPADPHSGRGHRQHR
jgi:hypothetical protein